MQDAITAYYQVRTANALDLTVEQVQRLDILEQNSDPRGGMFFADEEPFKVTSLGPICVEFVTYQDGIRYRGRVLRDGKVVWG